jgi:hypothetical protein
VGSRAPQVKSPTTPLQVVNLNVLSRGYSFGAIRPGSGASAGVSEEGDDDVFDQGAVIRRDVGARWDSVVCLLKAVEVSAAPKKKSGR